MIIERGRGECSGMKQFAMERVGERRCVGGGVVKWGGKERLVKEWAEWVVVED
jgi:hypothetical protein